MTKRTLSLSFGDLPRRPRPLSEKELADVFGGCVQGGLACDPNEKDPCCWFRTCKYLEGSGYGHASSMGASFTCQ
jgi:hypothetical protein